MKRVLIRSSNPSAIKPPSSHSNAISKEFDPVYQAGANSNLCFTARSSVLLKSSSADKSCLLGFLSCGEGRFDYNQQTAARLAETLPESGEGTRPAEAGGDCCRTKPDPSKPEQESTRHSGKQSAKATECLRVFVRYYPSSTPLDSSRVIRETSAAVGARVLIGKALDEVSQWVLSDGGDIYTIGSQWHTCCDWPGDPCGSCKSP